MRNAIITDEGRGYMFGAATAFFGLFLGYLWSPDYFEVVNYGYNFLYMAIAMMSLFFIDWIIDVCFKTKKDAKRGN